MHKIEINEIINYKIKRRTNYLLGGFYLIKNSINGKLYIGKSIDYMARIKQHIYPSNNKSTIDKDINLYGWQNFEYFLLENYINLDINYFNRQLETIYEHRFIKLHKTFHPFGYNQRYYGHL